MIELFNGIDFVSHNMAIIADPEVVVSSGFSVLSVANGMGIYPTRNDLDLTEEAHARLLICVASQRDPRARIYFGYTQILARIRRVSDA